VKKEPPTSFAEYSAGVWLSSELCGRSVCVPGRTGVKHSCFEPVHNVDEVGRSSPSVEFEGGTVPGCIH
jgi:hypothetical protein